MKIVILFFSLLFLTLYLPFSVTVYSESWYQYNFENQQYTDLVPKETVDFASHNLVQFLLHKQSLHDIFSQEEVYHYHEVRMIYDAFFSLALLSVIGLKGISRDQMRILAFVNCLLIFFVALLFIFTIESFEVFWNTTFHNVLFSNSLHEMTPDEISFYLFPSEFFLESSLFIMIGSLFINFLLGASTLLRKTKTGHEVS